MLPWLLLLCACAPMAPVLRPDQVQLAQAQFTGVSGVTLEHGRGLYVARCGSCHATPSADTMTLDEWKAELEEMAPRAKLSGSETQAVFQYLWASNQR